MREWIDAQIAAGLPALAGSRIAGTLAVSPELVNEVLAAWLGRPASAASATTPPWNLDALRAAVKSMSVRAESGRILIDFDVRMGG
jgi:hypothetical protein